MYVRVGCRGLRASQHTGHDTLPKRAHSLTSLHSVSFYPVHCAAQYGHTAILDYLKLHNARINVKDNDDRTPLHWAAYKNTVLTTQWLLLQGLDIGAVDTRGRSSQCTTTLILTVLLRPAHLVYLSISTCRRTISTQECIALGCCAKQHERAAVYGGRAGGAQGARMAQNAR